ncbi:MAG: YiiX/YebB-like N1pC/P60 family cysteine hydrolase [Proteobacteria bacterium]|nr:YiiX/YebB-like N1pC/P60 family cysteine hydrolase [Pseudomonadota bacterium]
MKELITRWLVKYLTKEIDHPAEVSGLGFDWRNVVQPGDVLLVEGRTRISAAIKYLTQSTWSHAALVLDTAPGRLIEANVESGIVTVGLGKYQHHNVRICRPIGLSVGERRRLLTFAESHVGISYDVKNLLDLARYLMPTPPVPVQFRRQMLTLGSGEPTEKLICSALIARAFQSIHYPILPIQWWSDEGAIVSQVRHYSVFVPRDFDLSPYFEIIKPTVFHGFNHREMNWVEEPPHV